uniref:Uncharacterized protein n=1 Tax=Romanomermis culicivorax TaxID=13658 RepID=A0A915IUF0_ROMCU
MLEKCLNASAIQMVKTSQLIIGYEWISYEAQQDVKDELLTIIIKNNIKDKKGCSPDQIKEA